MGTAENKAIAHRFHLEVIQQNNLDLADEIIAPDCVFHSSSGPREERGPEAAKAIARFDHSAFDDSGVKFDHDIDLAEGDFVAFHWINWGNSRRTGEAIKFEGLDLARMKDGKIAELWIEYHQVKE